MRKYTEKFKNISETYKNIRNFIVFAIIILGVYLLFFQKNNDQIIKIEENLSDNEISYLNCPVSSITPEIFVEPLITNNEIGFIDIWEDTDSSGKEKGEIPAIINPKFIDMKIAQNCIKNEEKVFVFIGKNGTVRIYPKSILNLHQVVHDVVDEEEIIITYSPFSDSFGGFLTNGNIFGVSGRIFSGNTLMYDKDTESLWLEMTGTAIIGDKTGEILKPLKVLYMSFSEAIEKYPDSSVLSFQTGFNFDYAKDPYLYFHESDTIIGESAIENPKSLKTISFVDGVWKFGDFEENPFEHQGYKYSIEEIVKLLNEH